ncbi:type VI secretion system baseplate subunit TssE [Tatumella terrea]|mgnify:CR=1 FL=1|uniref:Type VI secretion system baseplate subunit TssE n=1 Tax=Tatumella terrea TaxID=419007 RepID=A0ABW1W0L7_9GAMM
MKSGWRYPPALSDRLMGSDSTVNKNRDYRISADKMRQLVITEILELLNHTNRENEIDGEKYPQVLSSALNFGRPARRFFSGAEEGIQTENDIRTAILRFEPRVIPETLIVRVSPSRQSRQQRGTIAVEVSAMIYWHPSPLDLCLKGHYDRDTHRLSVR